ncbi:MAG: hypothetical protein LBQ66_07055, partial [Planctomycetaceae bacterium]|nr:hypothetical protein [Planctomycetaceae bacterium]
MFRSSCFRLALLAENVTAQRSVTHLTLTYNVFRSTVGEYADAIHQESLAVGCLPYDHQRK